MPTPSASDLAAALYTDGVVVIPVGPPAEMVGALFEYLRNIPETTTASQPVADTIFSGSGFGALNEPSTFHCKPVRDLRARVAAAVRPVLQAYVRRRELDPGADTHDSARAVRFEVLMDRLCVRHPTQLPMKESTHRDESIDALPDDTIFGGWLALAEPGQPPAPRDGDAFTAAKGSHRDATGAFLPAGGDGFTPMGKAEAAALQLTRVPVPPGSVVLFHQNLGHAITARRRKTPLCRLFVGHRLTKSTVPLHATAAPIVSRTQARPTRSQRMKKPRLVAGHTSPALATVLATMAGPAIPSGQQPAIISAFAWNMGKKRKYPWLKARYPPQLFKLPAWPEQPPPWSTVAYMDPAAAAARLRGRPDFPPYTTAEKTLCTPQPLF